MIWLVLTVVLGIGAAGAAVFATGGWRLAAPAIVGAV